MSFDSRNRISVTQSRQMVPFDIIRLTCIMYHRRQLRNSKTPTGPLIRGKRFTSQKPEIEINTKNVSEKSSIIETVSQSTNTNNIQPDWLRMWIMKFHLIKSTIRFICHIKLPIWCITRRYSIEQIFMWGGYKIIRDLGAKILELKPIYFFQDLIHDCNGYGFFFDLHIKVLYHFWNIGNGE